MTPPLSEMVPQVVAAAKAPPSGDAALLSCRITARPSATFVILAVDQGATPVPGIYAGEVEVADTRVPCSLRVVEGPDVAEVWCQPRGPLPPTRAGLFVRVRIPDSRLHGLRAA
jgi:hypothetical protein